MTGRCRRVGRLAVPAALAGAVVVLGATPALAATSISVTAPHLAGGKLSQNDTITVSGEGTATDPTGLSKPRTVTIRVTTPAGDSQVLQSADVASNKKSSLSATLDTACAPWSGCTPAANGVYTFVYSDANRTSQQSVTLAAPPAAPSGVAATAQGSVATFSWAANAEPDIVGYDVVDSAGHDVAAGGLDADRYCSGGQCEVSIDFGSAARGTAKTFGIVARRHTAPQSTGFLSGPATQTTVHFPAEPAPSGSPSSGGGSGAGGSGGATGTGSGGGHGAGPAGHGATGSGARPPSGKHPAGDLRQSLPTFTAGSAPDLPSVLTEVKPLPEGTYKPTLAYPAQVQRQQVRRPRTAGVTATVSDDISRVLDTGPLWRALAAAAVLLLVAAHLRSWLARIPSD